METAPAPAGFGRCLLPPRADVAHCVRLHIRTQQAPVTPASEGDAPHSSSAPLMRHTFHFEWAPGVAPAAEAVVQRAERSQHDSYHHLMEMLAAAAVDAEGEELAVGRGEVRSTSGGSSSGGGGDSTSHQQCGAAQWSPLAHALRCPARHGTYARVPRPGSSGSLPKPWVALAASVLVVSPGHGVLLTRRSAAMRTFPGMWVMPGGHVDRDEDLVDAALREVREEVGGAVAARLVLPPGCADGAAAQGATVGSAAASRTFPFFAAWESCFPVVPSDAAPRSHALAVYFAWPLREATGAEPEIPEVQLQASECDRFAWVRPRLIDGGDGFCLDGLEEDAQVAEGCRFMLRALLGRPGAAPGLCTHTLAAE